MTNLRRTAAGIIAGVCDQGQSLNELLNRLDNLDDRQRSWVRQVCYGVLRHRLQVESILGRYVRKPLKAKDRDIHWAIVVGLFQLGWMRTSDHAAIHETVSAIKAKWGRGLANAVLRNFQRDDASVDLESGSDSVRWSHPRWMVETLRKDWEQDAETVLEAAQHEAPMWLRVSGDRDSVVEELRQRGISATPGDGPAAIRLDQPQAPDTLPGFAGGTTSIQDQSAQFAAALLAPSEGSRVLDACTAPGGKAIHLAQLTPSIVLQCVESDPDRIQRTQENFARTGVEAPIFKANAAELDWWDGNPYDAILLDAPCSGSGVIRRHPDIKWLRRRDDIQTLASLQQELLTSLWRTLRPGGRLLYATCSVFRDENDRNLERWLALNPTATAVAVSLPVGRRVGDGWQILSGEGGGDGFFFALLEKSEDGAS